MGRIVDPDDGDIRDLGMSEQERFKLGRRDLEPCIEGRRTVEKEEDVERTFVLDELLDSVGDGKDAAFFFGDVARLEPAVGCDGVLGRVGSVQVSEHDVCTSVRHGIRVRVETRRLTRSLDPELALLTGRAVFAADRVDDPAELVGQEVANSAGVRLVRRAEMRRRGSLGETVCLRVSRVRAESANTHKLEQCRRLAGAAEAPFPAPGPSAPPLRR